jgi:hypothetical protein
VGGELGERDADSVTCRRVVGEFVVATVQALRATTRTRSSGQFGYQMIFGTRLRLFADTEDLVADREPGYVRADRRDRAGDVEAGNRPFRLAQPEVQPPR